MPTELAILQEQVRDLGEKAEALRYSDDPATYREARKAYLLAQSELYRLRKLIGRAG